MCTLTCSFQTSLHNPLITCQDMYIGPGWEVGVVEAVDRGMPGGGPPMQRPCHGDLALLHHSLCHRAAPGCSAQTSRLALGFAFLGGEVFGSVTHVPINTDVLASPHISIHPPLPHPTLCQKTRVGGFPKSWAFWCVFYSGSVFIVRPSLGGQAWVSRSQPCPVPLTRGGPAPVGPGSSPGSGNRDANSLCFQRDPNPCLQSRTKHCWLVSRDFQWDLSCELLGLFLAGANSKTPADLSSAVSSLKA